jgi:hypothetical protein
MNSMEAMYPMEHENRNKNAEVAEALFSFKRGRPI